MSVNLGSRLQKIGLVAQVLVEDCISMTTCVVRRVAREDIAEDECGRPVACCLLVVRWRWMDPSYAVLRTDYYSIYFLHHI